MMAEAPRAAAFGETRRHTWLEDAVTAVSGLVCALCARQASAPLLQKNYMLVLLLQLRWGQRRTPRCLEFVRVGACVCRSVRVRTHASADVCVRESAPTRFNYWVSKQVVFTS